MDERRKNPLEDIVNRGIRERVQKNPRNLIDIGLRMQEHLLNEDAEAIKSMMEIYGTDILNASLIASRLNQRNK